MTNVEQRARELLAQQFDLDGARAQAAAVRRGCFDLEGEYASNMAIRAIVAALRQQAAPVDLEQFREAVRAYGRHEVHDADSAAYHDCLLSIIDNAGKVGQCCMCGGPVDTRENGTPGAQLTDGRWTCSEDCWDSAVDNARQPAPVVDDAMVERLARAWCDQTDTGFDALPEAGRQLCLHHMRIALTAALARAT